MSAPTFQIEAQPDNTTCGPTSLHAVYAYYGDDISLEQVIAEVPAFEQGGGTLGVLLANHALRRGYRAAAYTWNLRVFDPTWFRPDAGSMIDRLRLQLVTKSGLKLHFATEAYIEFLQLGGRLRFDELTPELLRRELSDGTPVLAGVSATYLYNSSRETEHGYDDVRGEAQGHFLVLTGYDRARNRVHVADPFTPNPLSSDRHYDMPVARLIGAIYLGVLTYDGNLMVIRPGDRA